MSEPLFVLLPDVVWDMVDDVATVCNLSNGQVKELNRAGALIWTMGLKYDITEVVDRIAAMHPTVDRSIVRDDLMTFADSLIDLELIEARPAQDYSRTEA